jgi:hypothetical protein
MGKSYHQELFEYINKMVAEKTISPDDVQLFLFTDSVPEAIQHINTYAIEGYGLKKKQIIKPSVILGERILLPELPEYI